VTFTQPDQAGAPTTVTVSVAGAGAAGPRGFHIHQNAGLANACADAGPHFNPLGKLHGAGGNSAPYGRPDDPTQRHVGDLGNVEVVDGAISVTFSDTQISLRPGDAFSIVNRAVVLHAQVDDLGQSSANPLTNTTGNAGARVSCGTIVATLQGRQLRGAEAEGA
jgi:Cu-Zn family superoxide dismutase